MSTPPIPISTMDDSDIPRGNAAGFVKYFRYDILSGFLVFLIALPLCLGIALACGYPAIAGIFTAIIGAILTTFISDSELTIKGPAAGLIVIAIGCVEAFGGDGPIGGFTATDITAYKMALAVGVVAAVLQILFGVFRAGILAEFFPLAAVHGMLAAIGVIIMVKQLPIALGVRGAKGEPLEMIREIPHFFKEMNPEIAVVGGVSLLIMFLWPSVQKLHKAFKTIPGPMIVLLVAVPLGMAFDLTHTHIYSFHGHEYQLGEEYLVAMPDHMFGMFNDLTFPDFTALKQPVAWKWVFMFFVIGSLESLLSAKAIDLIDPWKRKTNLDRDMIAVGLGNVACALVGGLPMISEIVRSKANIDNGARTRFADLWHGIFLLVCVALIPTVLHLIPLAALAAMLVYTGFRLTHPSEFMHVLRIGKEQLLIFVVTLLAVLATDLLVGIAIGIFVKVLIHLLNGVPLRSVFKPYLDVETQSEDTVLVTARYSAVFSNWIPFRRQLVDLGLKDKKNVILDLGQTRLVDHSVMGKLQEMKRDFSLAGVTLKVVGLDGHHGLSSNELATQKRSLTRLRRLTVIASQSLEEEIESRFLQLGATGYTAIPCRGAGLLENSSEHPEVKQRIRIEVVASAPVVDALIDYLRQDIINNHHVTICVENVAVIRRDHFVMEH